MQKMNLINILCIVFNGTTIYGMQYVIIFLLRFRSGLEDGVFYTVRPAIQSTAGGGVLDILLRLIKKQVSASAAAIEFTAVGNTA